MSDSAGWLKQSRVRVLDDGDVTRVRLRGMTPQMAVIGTILVALVIGAFVVPMSAMLPGVLRTIAIGVYLVGSVAAAIGLAAHRRRMIRSGREDLVIADGTIRLPWGLGREADVVVPIDRITEITTADEVPDTSHRFDASTEKFGPQQYVKKDADPDEELPPVGARSTMVHVVLICWLDDTGGESAAPIARWSSRARVRGLTFWLRERLGIERAVDQTRPSIADATSAGSTAR